MAVERWPVIVAMLAGDFAPLPGRPGRQFYRADFGSDRTARLLEKVFGDDEEGADRECRKPPPGAPHRRASPV